MSKEYKRRQFSPGAVSEIVMPSVDTTKLQKRMGRHLHVFVEKKYKDPKAPVWSHVGRMFLDKRPAPRKRHIVPVPAEDLYEEAELAHAGYLFGYLESVGDIPFAVSSLWPMIFRKEQYLVYWGVTRGYQPDLYLIRFDTHRSELKRMLEESFVLLSFPVPRL